MASKPVRFVRGVVRQEPTGVFLEGATVVARFRPGSSAAERARESVGKGLTDKDGAFRIALHPSLFGENARPGTIEFAVEQDGLPVPLAGQTTWSYDPRRLPGDIVLCVAERHECRFSEEPPNPSVSSGERSVRGIVRHEDGTPIDGLKIEVVRVQLGALAPQTPTDLTGAKGDYGIVLTDDANPWHIFIRAYIVGTPDEEVGASAVLSNAPVEARIDLEIDDDRLRSKSRYKGLLEAVDPARGGISYTGLQPNQTALIAREVGLPLREVTEFVVAVRLALAMGLNTFLDSPPTPDRAEQVYGLLRVGWPRNVAGFLARDRSRVERELCRAADWNDVSRDAADDHAGFTSDLADSLVSLALDPTTPSSLGLLLDESGLSTALQTTLLEAARDHTGDAASFWDAMRQPGSGLTVAEVDAAERVVRLGVLTRNHPPLVARLETTLAGAPLSTVAEWTQSEWETEVDAAGVPDWVEGADAAERRTNYVAGLLDLSERAWPSVRYRKRLLDSTVEISPGVPVVSSGVKTWLNANPTKDLQGDHFPNDGSPEMSELRMWQRLYRVAPPTGRAEAMLHVAAHGYQSAYQVATGGKQRFVDAVDPDVPQQVALAVYANAQAASHAALLLLLQNHPNLSQGLGNVIDGLDGSSPPAALPDYASLFGSLDWCACEHCRSITGPGAYFVDLMEWVRVRGGLVEAGGAWSLLGGRRPDLGTVLVSCANADTPLPYIDLVIEIFERAVANIANDGVVGFIPDIDPIASGWTAPELAVAPEHPYFLDPTNPPQAEHPYATLAGADFPVSLPLHYLEEVQKTFLRHLGIPRLELWELWRVDTSAGTTIGQVARERLGITLRAGQLITNNDGGSIDEWRYWFASNPGAAWESTVKQADEFTSRQELSFEETEELLRCRAAGAVGAASPWDRVLELDAAGDPCVLANWAVQPVGGGTPTASRLRGLSRFVRLSRTAPWSPAVLDRVLLSLGIGDVEGTPDLDVDAQEKLGSIRKLESLLSKSAGELCVLWSDLDLYVGPAGEDASRVAAYDALFLNPLLVPDARESGFAFELNPTRTDFAAAPELGEVVDKVAGALRVDTTEIWEAADWLGFSDTTTLALADLSAIARRVLLARWLGWLTADLRVYLETAGTGSAPLGADPFAAADPRETLRFVEQVAPLRAAGLTGSEWSWLLRNDAASADRVGPSIERLTADVGSVRDAVRHTSATAEGSETVTAAGLRDAVLDALVELTGLPRPVLVDLDERSQALPVGSFAGVFLGRAFRVGGGVPVGGEAWADLDPDDLRDAPAFRAMHHLHKLALLWDRAGIELEEQRAWLDQAWGSDPATAQLPDPLDLDGGEPIATPGAAPELDLLYRRLLRTLQLRPLLPEASSTLAAVFEDGLSAEGLADSTGWSIEEMTLLFTELVDGEPTLDDLPRIAGAMELARRAGVDGVTLASWVYQLQSEFDETVANSVVAAARSRYSDEASWVAVARPLRDSLREQLRRGLIRWVIAHDPALTDRTEAGLYGRYLVDPEMGPWLQTTRLKAAASALQIYVQRGFLGLEAGLTFDEDDAQQWEWMKSYRVWEAARKVFLYPENWIEPELRDDKTPLFRKLEEALGQNEVTDDAVEGVLLGYLHGLDEVADLMVLGCYQQTWQDEVGVDRSRFHVVARTRSHPHSYWYRSRGDDGVFSPWEAIDCGLEGDHVQPVVFQRRLMLFWVTFESPAEGDYSLEWDAALSWSERRGAGWSARRTSRDLLRVRGWDLEALALQIGDAQGTSELSIELGWFPDVADGQPMWASTSRVGAWLFDGCRDLVVSVPDSDSLGGTHSSEAVLRPAGQGWRTRPPTGDVRPTFQLTVHSVESADLLDELGNATGDSHPPLVPYPLFADRTTSTRIVYPRAPGMFAFNAPFLVEAARRHQDDTDIEGRAAPVRGFLVTSGLLAEEEALDEDGSLPFSVEHRYKDSWVTDEAWEAEFHDDFGDTDTGDVEEAYEESGLEAIVELAPAWGRFRFWIFHHPWVCTFVEAVRRAGARALLAPSGAWQPDLHRQQLEVDTFDLDFTPTDHVDPRYPVGDVDFEFDAAYGTYNWELFFHAPVLIASRLAQGQRFDDALRWLRTVFDPFDSSAESAPGKYWKVRPLFEEDPQAPVTNWAAFTGASGNVAAAQRFAEQVAAWRDDPFNPHLLARLRPGTYGKFVVMRFIDTLIAWGDQLFRRDTMESIAEATQLYLLAGQLLGDRPTRLPPADPPQDLSYNQLEDVGLDDFSNAIINIENMGPQTNDAADEGGPVLLSLGTLIAYFCIPQNPKLLGYWETVADRLFKLRNGFNIEGLRRELPLYQPPIDPALLVRARAMGLDLATVLGDLARPLPKYRFTVMLSRAQSLCGTVRALGGALLSALEKRDAEELALLRSTHEVRIADAVRDVRREQVREAKAQLDAVEASRAVVQARHDHYAGLIEVGLLPAEHAEIALTVAAGAASSVAGVLRGVGAILASMPQIVSDGKVEFGGVQLSGIVNGLGSFFETGAGELRLGAQLSARGAAHERRKQDWEFQRDLAGEELDQLDEQILAAEIRVDLAERELAIQERQAEQAREVDDFLGRKFTRRELYSWMVGQVSTLYFQTYQLAYDVAKQAQKCFQHETGDPAASFVQFGHWDSLKKGLLAGERLGLDLDRMDTAYIAADVREREITRHISLDRLDPGALMQLRLTGECLIELPEWLFDMDFPGHYFRRIQGVSLTIDAVVADQRGLAAELTLLREFRRDSVTTAFSADEYVWAGARANSVGETVAISGAVDDSGVFRFEFTGPRYVPFERRGAVSQWRLKLTGHPAAFDWTEIGDVTMHLRYTARSNAAARPAVMAAIDSLLATPGTVPGPPIAGQGVRALSLATEFPDAWEAFLQDLAAAAPGAPVTAEVALLPEHLPYGHAAGGPTVGSVHLWAVGPEAATIKASAAYGSSAATVALTPTGTPPFVGGAATFAASGSPGDTLFVDVEKTTGPGTGLSDLVVVFEYEV